jgi:hypothetical protein
MITVGEVRLAWGALILLAALSYPTPPSPQPIDFAASLLAFGPGTFILSTAKGAARVTGGVGRLGNETLGRVSLLAGVGTPV